LQLFCCRSETDKLVAEKTAAAIKGGLKVQCVGQLIQTNTSCEQAIACIGETLQEREAGKTFEVLARQVVISKVDD